MEGYLSVDDDYYLNYDIIAKQNETVIVFDDIEQALDPQTCSIISNADIISNYSRDLANNITLKMENEFKGNVTIESDFIIISWINQVKLSEYFIGSFSGWLWKWYQSMNDILFGSQIFLWWL